MGEFPDVTQTAYRRRRERDEQSAEIKRTRRASKVEDARRAEAQARAQDQAVTEDDIIIAIDARRGSVNVRELAALEFRRRTGMDVAAFAPRVRVSQREQRARRVHAALADALLELTEIASGDDDDGEALSLIRSRHGRAQLERMLGCEVLAIAPSYLTKQGVLVNRPRYSPTWADENARARFVRAATAKLLLGSADDPDRKRRPTLRLLALAWLYVHGDEKVAAVAKEPARKSRAKPRCPPKVTEADRWKAIVDATMRALRPAFNAALAD